MSDKAEGLTRRSFVQALACASLVSPDTPAPPKVGYSLKVQPAQALLGTPITATLMCVSCQNDTEAVTFQDSSLELELTRLPAQQEPVSAFLNREVTQNGSLQIRNRIDGEKHLAKGERLTREIPLLEIYPRWMLDVGEFQLTYKLGPETRPFYVSPATIKVGSGPAAIPNLFALLDHVDPGVRARASGLLHRMTACITGYGYQASIDQRQTAIARWRQWWKAIGSILPWNFQSDGATFSGKPSGPPNHSGRSQSLGGVAYAYQALDSTSTAIVASALHAWLNDSSGGLEALKGKRWIADTLVHYPREDVMVDPGECLATMLASVLSHLPERTASATIILNTIARMPNQLYLDPLSTLEALVRNTPEWHQSSLIIGGLLDLLDPGRTPTGLA